MKQKDRASGFGLHSCALLMLGSLQLLLLFRIDKETRTLFVMSSVMTGGRLNHDLP